MDGRDLENVTTLQFTELHHTQDDEHAEVVGFFCHLPNSTRVHNVIG